MKDFNVHVWHYGLSLKTYKPVVEKKTFKVALDKKGLIPSDFEERYLSATMKNVKLSDEFKHEFGYGLPRSQRDEIERQLSGCLKNAALAVIDLAPGVSFVFSSGLPSVKSGICCDYEIPTFEEKA